MLASDPALSMLDAVEFVTPNPSERLSLYRFLGNSEDAQADDLDLLERRKAAEGFLA